MHPFNSFTYMCIYRSSLMMSLMTVILFPNKFFLLLSLIKLYTSTHSFIHPIFSFISHPINSFRLEYVVQASKKASKSANSRLPFRVTRHYTLNHSFSVPSLLLLSPFIRAVIAQSLSKSTPAKQQ